MYKPKGFAQMDGNKFLLAILTLLFLITQNVGITEIAAKATAKI